MSTPIVPGKFYNHKILNPLAESINKSADKAWCWSRLSERSPPAKKRSLSLSMSTSPDVKRKFKENIDDLAINNDNVKENDDRCCSAKRFFKIKGCVYSKSGHRFKSSPFASNSLINKLQRTKVSVKSEKYGLSKGYEINGTKPVERTDESDHLSKKISDENRNKSRQMVLDFGQKIKGPKQCSTCGLTYNATQPSDDLFHKKYHKNFFAAFKINITSRNRIVQNLSDGAVIIMVLESDKTLMLKVEQIRKVVDVDLGFVLDQQSNAPFKAFLYVKDNQVIGFCLVQAITSGFRMVDTCAPLPEDVETKKIPNCSDDKNGSKQPYCCSVVPEPVKCGINRIWVSSLERRKGVATRLLDSVRGHFSLGYPLTKHQIAFSDPTPDGISLATAYTGSPYFLVYKN